jgi:glycerol-3-phosphate acyltransferase PlsY
MNPLLAVAAAISGYLIGSISFSQLMLRLLGGGKELSIIEHRIEGKDVVFQSSSTGATAVRFQFGDRYGCLVAILDMFKALVPALILKVWQPDAAYYLIAATMAIVGHNYPVFHRFKGGRGLATVYGGLFVLDWAGVLATSIGGILLGGLLGQVLMMRWLGLMLMIPWIWFRTHDVIKLAYVLVASALFWIAMIPELREYFRLRRDGLLPDEQEVADFMGMGGAYRAIQRYSPARLIQRRARGAKQ